MKSQQSQHKKKTPHLTLVGAGPGDPDLITVKGLQAIHNADVILYDALINPELLEYAGEQAKCIFVGKRKGFKQFPQDHINRIIVNYALEGKHVVRLKGGDPFVFGRGSEEIEYAESFGIKTSVVPGLSSATALTSNRKIALTKRGVTESFWVITGTTSNNQLAADIQLAAQSTATVVVLMGMGKLRLIVNQFKKHHSDDYPVVIIENGTTEIERILIGDLSNIVKKVEKDKFANPAIIVFGEALRGLSHKKQLPLELIKKHIE